MENVGIFYPDRVYYRLQDLQNNNDSGFISIRTTMLMTVHFNFIYKKAYQIVSKLLDNFWEAMDKFDSWKREVPEERCTRLPQLPAGDGARGISAQPNRTSTRDLREDIGATPYFTRIKYFITSAH